MERWGCRPVVAVAWVTVLILLSATLAPAERYHHDDPGRLVRVIYDDLSSITYSYDPNSNITSVTVTAAGAPGDADLDGDVDQADLDLITQAILDGGETYSATADCTLDDVVSVADLVCAVGTSPPVAFSPPSLDLAEVVSARSLETEVPAALLGVDGVARAAQLDLTFDPSVVTVVATTAGAAASTHTVATAVVEPGRLRVVVYSPVNAAIAEGALVDVRFAVAADAALGPSDLVPEAAEVVGPDAVALTPLALLPGEIDVLAAAADLGLTKTASTAVVDLGQQLTFAVVATNAGGDPVLGARFEDPVAAGLGSVSWTCAVSGGASCSAFGSGDIDDLVNLPVGAAATYTVTATALTDEGTITNTATLSPPVGVFDPSITNNTASASVEGSRIFGDGFESSDTTVWSASVP